MMTRFISGAFRSREVDVPVSLESGHPLGVPPGVLSCVLWTRPQRLSMKNFARWYGGQRSWPPYHRAITLWLPLAHFGLRFGDELPSAAGAGMTQLKLFCFGPPRVERDGQPVEIGLRKAWALLIYLAVTKQPHSRDALATLLWPNSDQRTSRASLRRTLHQLGQFLGVPILAAGPETLSLASTADIWLDIDDFQASAAACLPQARLAGRLDGGCVQRLTEAAALYADDFLAGYSLPDSPAFD